jgi:hypothetical protein
VYSAGGGTLIAGLTEGQTYYVIPVPGQPTEVQLALDQIAAQNDSAIPISYAGLSGTAQSLWDGTIDNVSPTVQTPGPQIKTNLNGNGSPDPDQTALSNKYSPTPDTISANGVVVAALNQDTFLTFAISGGGAGTVAVNIGGMTNVMHATVAAYIGNAQINQNLSGTPGALQGVYVLAGNNYYHIGIAAVANGAGTVSVTPDADILVLVNNVSAYISDGASVSARQNVIMDAHAKELVVSVSVGITGAGEVSVAGSFSIISIVNTTQAYIGEDGGTGATVNAGGTVLVDAYDATQVVLVAGSLGLGFGAVGVGASIGVLVEVKNTSAFIGAYSIVNGKGNGPALANMVYTNRMGSDGSFSTYAGESGVIVQAYSNDNIITVAGSGAFGFYTGVAGAVLVDVFLSNTYAYIGNNAMINQDRTAVSPNQDVVVNALNHSWIFDFAGSIGAGIVGVGGAIEVNVIRNTAKAYIGNLAEVTATHSVLLSALNNKDLIVVAASLGGGAGLP